MVNRAVFLDRDGVLVIPVNGAAPRTLEEFNIFPEAPHAIQRLRAAGFSIVVVTNQPDVGNGFITHRTLRKMHDELKRNVRIDLIETCTHSAGSACWCRKPRPGMLNDSAFKLGISLSDSFMVGDRWTDIAAGRVVGCKTVLIGEPQGFTPTSLNGEKPDYIVPSIFQAADVILVEAKNVARGK